MAITTLAAWEVDNGGVPSTSLVFPNHPAVIHADVVVGVVLADTTKSVSSIVDSVGNTYVRRGFVNNGTSVRTELWEAQNTTVSFANNAVTVTFTGLTAAVATYVLYSGVLSQTTGMTAQNTNTSTGSDTRPGVVLGVQEVGNWVAVVMGLADVAIVPDPMINTAGSLIALRYWVWTASVGIIQCDTDVYGLGGDPTWDNVPVNAHIYAPCDWACVALELRSGGIAPPPPPIPPGSFDIDDLVGWSYTFTEGAVTTPGFASNADVTCGFAKGGCPPGGGGGTGPPGNFSH